MSRGQRQFAATAVRSGRQWAVSIELPGVIAYTQGRDLRDAASMARDAVATALNVDISEVTVALTVDVGAINDLAETAALAVARREEAAKAADTAMRTAALALAGRGINTRDAGQILGVSHQRVSQLLTKRAA